MDIIAVDDTILEEIDTKNKLVALVRLIKAMPQNRDKEILVMRYGLNGTKPMSLKEVGDNCHLTKERIRQIEKHAIARLQHPTRARRLVSFVA
jgi:RNA polymerase sigma factor (sigma-70 family)